MFVNNKMAACVDCGTIYTMVNAKVRLNTADGVFTGTVVDKSDKKRVVLHEVTGLDPMEDKPARLPGLITIMVYEINDWKCLHLPGQPLPEAPKLITDDDLDNLPVGEAVKHLNSVDKYHKEQKRKLLQQPPPLGARSREPPAAVVDCRGPTPSRPESYIGARPRSDLREIKPPMNHVAGDNGARLTSKLIEMPLTEAGSMPRNAMPLTDTEEQASFRGASNELYDGSRPRSRSTFNETPKADTGAGIKSLYDKCIKFNGDPADVPSMRPVYYVVVDFFGELFTAAISLIKSFSIIGVGFDGVELGRYGRLCWINISTNEIVILFDMRSLSNIDDAFNNGFREIFESSNITKIVHDCRQVSDILRHQYETELKNVYDTQVADIMIYRSKSNGRMPDHVRALGSLLMEFLGLSKAQVAFHQIRKSALERDPEIWLQRPQEPMYLQLAALNVRYLRELRKATLNGILKDFTDGVGLYLDVRDIDTSGGRMVIQNDETLPRSFLMFGPCLKYGAGGGSGPTIGEMIENLTQGSSIFPLSRGNSRTNPPARNERLSLSPPVCNGYDQRQKPCSNPHSRSNGSVSIERKEQRLRENTVQVKMYPAGMNVQRMEDECRRRNAKSSDRDHSRQNRPN